MKTLIPAPTFDCGGAPANSVDFVMVAIAVNPEPLPVPSIDRQISGLADSAGVYLTEMQVRLVELLRDGPNALPDFARSPENYASELQRCINSIQRLAKTPAEQTV